MEVDGLTHCERLTYLSRCSMKLAAAVMKPVAVEPPALEARQCQRAL